LQQNNAQQYWMENEGMTKRDFEESYFTSLFSELFQLAFDYLQTTVTRLLLFQQAEENSVCITDQKTFRTHIPIESDL
jgi:hypothetical protein